MLPFVPFLLLFVGLCGCGQRGPAVQLVEGTVSLDGVPVSNADVCFSPTKGSEGIPALGKTDSNGVYRLTSAQGGDFGEGAVVGDYEVRIIKFVDLDYVKPAHAGKTDPITGIVMPIPMAKAKHHLPEKYADVKTSGLTATVKKGKNQIDFNLEK